MEHDIESPFYCLLITADWCHSCFPLTSLFFWITSLVSYKKPLAIMPISSLLFPLRIFPHPLVPQLCNTVHPAWALCHGRRGHFSPPWLKAPNEITDEMWSMLSKVWHPVLGTVNACLTGVSTAFSWHTRWLACYQIWESQEGFLQQEATARLQ